MKDKPQNTQKSQKLQGTQRRSKESKRRFNRSKDLFLLIFCVLSLTFGCGKKQPIGYSIVEPRAGEIKSAWGWINSFVTYSEFVATSNSQYLYVGISEDSSFRAISFLSFDPEILNPDSLFLIKVDSSDTGVIRVCVTEEWDTDSLTWSNFPDTSDVFVTVTVAAGDTCAIDFSGFPQVNPPAMFSIGLLPEEGLIGFYSKNSTNDPWLRFPGDSDTVIIRAEQGVYIDTSYYSPDTLSTMIQTGAYVTECTLYLELMFPTVDTLGTTAIDTADFLTDSLREALMLSEAKINQALLYIPVDPADSYKEDISIKADYNGIYSSSFYNKPRGDSLVLSIEDIVQAWFEEGDTFWLVLKPTWPTNSISRVVLQPDSAELYIIYTLPPEERE